MVETDFSSPIRKRTRQGRPRSRLGCVNCRKRHVKCDEGHPECRNCLRLGLECAGPVSTKSGPRRRLPLFAFAAPDPRPGRGDLESKVFHRYATELAPLVAGRADSWFWVRVVCPVAEENEAIFNAVLGVTCLYTLPKAEVLSNIHDEISTIVQKRYSSAIEWYCSSCSSLAETAKTLSCESLTLLLISSIIHIYTELRLGHSKNVQTLLKAAFALLFDNKDLLIRNYNSMILISITSLLGLPLNETAHEFLLEQHWRNAIVLALYMAAELSIHRGWVTIIEMYNLHWDICHVTDGNSMGNDRNLDSRMYNAYQTILALERKGKESGAGGYVLLQIQWQVYRNGLYTGRRSLEDRLEIILGNVEAFTHFLDDTGRTTLSWDLDISLVPACIFVAWYWREPIILARITALFSQYDGEQDFIRTVLDYIKVLTIETGYYEETELERRVFGKRPKVLHISQCHALTTQLVRDSIARSTKPSPLYGRRGSDWFPVSGVASRKDSGNGDNHGRGRDSLTPPPSLTRMKSLVL